MRQAGTLARERPRPPSLPHKGASRRKHARGARPMVAGCGRALDVDGSSGGGVGGVSLHSSTTPLSLSSRIVVAESVGVFIHDPPLVFRCSFVFSTF